MGRSQPGELSFGSYGTGSINHLGAELFNAMAKIQANHVPYRGVRAGDDGPDRRPAATTCSTASPPRSAISRAGTIRVLGVAGPNRSPVLPDQPTIAEAGLPGFETMVWFGLFAPAGTPKPIVESAEQQDQRRSRLAAREGGIRRSSASKRSAARQDVLAAKVQSELQKWATIVREKNIRLEQ